MYNVKDVTHRDKPTEYYNLFSTSCSSWNLLASVSSFSPFMLHKIRHIIYLLKRWLSLGLNFQPLFSVLKVSACWTGVQKHDSWWIFTLLNVCCVCKNDFKIVFLSGQWGYLSLSTACQASITKASFLLQWASHPVPLWHPMNQPAGLRH